MKKKITIKFFDNTEKTIEINERDPEYLKSLQKYPSRIFKNKKAYTRKIKHKGNNDYE